MQLLRQEGTGLWSGDALESVSSTSIFPVMDSLRSSFDPGVEFQVSSLVLSELASRPLVSELDITIMHLIFIFTES